MQSPDNKFAPYSYLGKPYPRELGPDGVVLMIEASRVNVLSWDPG